MAGPPEPPPLPPPFVPKPSKYVEKLHSAPPEFFNIKDTKADHFDLLAPRAGPYFFYGTLQHPKVVSSVLSLTKEEESPELRPAKVIGYHRMLWGPYPALVDGVPGEVVQGKGMKIESQGHAKRLQEYETNAYEVRSVTIVYTDGEEPTEEQGFAFLAVDKSDLEEGKWNLEEWERKFWPKA